MLKDTDKSLEFTLKDDKGELVSLSDFKGKKVVLYFYPKDNTSGCTKQACAFRDAYDEFLAAGAVVIGVSKDSVASHERFKSKQNLPFYLLSDEEGTVLESYGVWQEKKMYGKTYMGIVRSTFVIDEEGIIIKTFPKVKIATHVEDVLKVLR